jgi:hypothetical protein
MEENKKTGSQKAFEEFISEKLGFSLTIKTHVLYKCISTWEPDWQGGFCLLSDQITNAGSNHHPHAQPHHHIQEKRLSAETMEKIRLAIVKVIEEKKINFE